MKHASLLKATLALTLAAGLPCALHAQAPEAAPDAELQTLVPSPLEEFYFSIDDLLSANKLQEATEKFATALKDPKYAEYKGQMLTVYIRFLLFTEQVDLAKTEFMNIIRTEPENAMPGFDLIYGYLKQRPDGEDATLDWVRALLIQPLTAEMKLTATEWLFTELLSYPGAPEAAPEREAEIIKLLPDFVATANDEQGSALLNRLCSIARQAGNYTFADRVLDTCEAAPKKESELFKNTLFECRTLNLVARSDWANIPAKIAEGTKFLPDIPLQRILAQTAAASRRDKKENELELICNTMLHAPEAADKRSALNVASREWVLCAAARGDLPLIPARVGELIDLKIAPTTVFTIVSRHFYNLLDKTEILKDLLVQMDRLSPMLADDMRNALNSQILDASFILEDYDRALKLLTDGIADHDANWHALALTKVRAHKALKEKKYDEAIVQFRKFMEFIEKGEEQNTPDPTTNAIHTRETLLGRNAKRIGDIYTEAKRPADAAKAYAEAKAFFNKALEKNTQQRDEAQKTGGTALKFRLESYAATEAMIREELKAIP